MIESYGNKFYTDGPRGWISVDNYNDDNFKMNDRREADFDKAIEKAEKFLQQSDIDSIEYVRSCFRRGSKPSSNSREIIKTGIHAYQRLDTIVRDCFPQWVWELAGSSVNPRYWRYENSLHGTEA